jgi:ribose transport system ATP-binding protein
MSDNALEILNLSKTFEGTAALRNVSMSVRPGEVRGLLGQNGSGKSTLIKILAGYHQPDAGAELRAYGRAVPNPLHSGVLSGLGWAFVHQDLGLLEDLRVIDNFHLVGLGTAGARAIRWGRDGRRVTGLLNEFGVCVKSDALVRDLSAVEKAMVAIVRAAALIRRAEDQGQSGLLVLDEPTVYLTEEEVQALFELIRTLAGQNVAVIFVSHQLTEIRAVADSVTVLRDGAISTSGKATDLSDDQLVAAIVGHAVNAGRIRRRTGSGDVFARVTGMAGGTVMDMSMNVCRGEVVGVTGLAGSGFEDVPYLLFGAMRARSGQLELGGEQVRLPGLNPWTAMSLGAAFLPGNRLRQGGVGALSVSQNITLPTLDRHCLGGFLRRSGELRRSRELTAKFDVKPADPRKRFAMLSGGNQQKALLAKWLETEPALLLLHEPTQGLDVGAREDVITELRAQAGQGKAVLCASSDWEQLEQLCDRVVVMRRGRIAAELHDGDITEARIASESLQAAEADV